MFYAFENWAVHLSFLWVLGFLFIVYEIVYIGAVSYIWALIEVYFSMAIKNRLY